MSRSPVGPLTLYTERAGGLPPLTSTDPPSAGRYLRRITPAAVLGYVSGVAALLLQSAWLH